MHSTLLLSNRCPSFTQYFLGSCIVTTSPSMRYMLCNSIVVRFVLVAVMANFQIELLDDGAWHAARARTPRTQYIIKNCLDDTIPSQMHLLKIESMITLVVRYFTLQIPPPHHSLDETSACAFI
eukprot:308784_1